MRITRFEDIIAWQKSRSLVVAIYTHFKHCCDYAFRDQITRAIVSVPTNIAEGFERRTKKDFTSFLYIAKASAAEVKSLLYLSSDLGYIESTVFTELVASTDEVGKILSGLIATVDRYDQ